MTDKPPSAGGLGRYHLGEPLGGGPTGEVFRAKVYGVAGFERQYALKRFHAALAADPTTAEILAASARAYAAVSHPHIARLHEYGVAQGQSFVAVELVSGLDVARLLSQSVHVGDPMPRGAVLAAIGQIARGVGYAHARGVAHLGICPTNVVISADGDPKVTDFGFLRSRLGAQPAEDATLLARLPYLAPEQIEGAAGTPATDVFQIATLAYELLLGERAFGGKNAGAIAEAILAGPPPAADLPPPVWEVLAKAFARDPGARQANAGVFADAFEATVKRLGLPGGRSDLGAAIKRAQARTADLTAGIASGALSFPLPAPPPSTPGVPLAALFPGGEIPRRTTLSTLNVPPPPPPTRPPSLPASASSPAATSSPPPLPPAAASSPPARPASSPASNPPGRAGSNPPATATSSSPPASTSSPPPPPPAVVAPPPPAASEPVVPVRVGRTSPAARARARRTSIPQPAVSESPRWASAPTPAVDPTPPPMPPLTMKRSRWPLFVVILAVLGAGGYLVYDQFFAEAPAEVAVADAGASRLAALVGPDSGLTPVAVRTHQPTAAAADAQPAPAPLLPAPPDAMPPPPPPPSTRPDAPAPPAPKPLAPSPPEPVAPAPDGKLVVASEPAGAEVFIDGAAKGRTPLELPASGDKHKLAVFLQGYKLARADIDGRGRTQLALEKADHFKGRAGIKVRCATERRLYVTVDDRDTGLMCPTERIPVELGEHTVGTYDPQSEEVSKQTVKVVETHFSLRVTAPGK